MTTLDNWFADDFTVLDENRLTVATACDADTAEQIAREHNRIEALDAPPPDVYGCTCSAWERREHIPHRACPVHWIGPLERSA